MGDFFKKFEQAVENVATLAVENASSAFEEYPNQGAEAAPRARVSLSGFGKKALEYWREADIEGKRSGWNDKRLEIEQAQRADRTAPPTAQALRQRLTSSEALLLSLLDLLVEAPDPSHDLAEGRDMEVKVTRLTRDMERLQEEVGNAAKGSEEAKELRDKVKHLESSLAEAEESLQTKASELEKVVAAQAAFNVKELQEREALQKAELERAQDRLRALMLEHEQTQNALFELTERGEEERAAQAAQNDLVAAEVERAQQQVAELERLRTQMNRKLGGLVEVGDGESIKEQPSDAALHSLEVMIAAKDHMISQLKDQLAQTSTLLSRAQAEAEDRVVEARAALRSSESRALALAKEVERRCDPEEVENLKKQVVALASLVDSEMEAEGWMAEMGSKHADKGMVNGWLQERNKKLADEVTQLKWKLAEKAKDAEKLSKELQEVCKDLRGKEALVVNLERDLERALSGGAAAGTNNTLGTAASPVVGSSAHPHVNSGTGGAEEMLPIVVQQRDRYRALLAKAEEELSSCQDSLAKTTSKLEAARTDNVCLFEKIRYLESYSHQQAKQLSRTVKVDSAGVPLATGAAASRYQCGPLSVSVGADDDDAELAVGRAGADGLTRRGLRYQCFGVNDDEEPADHGVEGRYRKEYEDRLNPFARFKHREANAGINGLPVSDRAVLASGQWLAGSKFARAFVAIYAAFLHLFVFVALYSAAS